MKYLKYFEKKNKKEIWIVPMDETIFLIAKWKIGANNSFNWMVKREKEDDHILLHYSDNFEGDKNRDDNWTYSSVDSVDISTNKKFVDSVEFMGKVEISQEDKKRYYAEKEAEKYNL